MPGESTFTNVGQVHDLLRKVCVFYVKPQYVVLPEEEEGGESQQRQLPLPGGPHGAALLTTHHTCPAHLSCHLHRGRPFTLALPLLPAAGLMLIIYFLLPYIRCERTICIPPASLTALKLIMHDGDRHFYSGPYYIIFLI